MFFTQQRSTPLSRRDQSRMHSANEQAEHRVRLIDNFRMARGVQSPGEFGTVKHTRAALITEANWLQLITTGARSKTRDRIVADDKAIRAELIKQIKSRNPIELEILEPTDSTYGYRLVPVAVSERRLPGATWSIDCHMSICYANVWHAADPKTGPQTLESPERSAEFDWTLLAEIPGLSTALKAKHQLK